MPRHPGQGRDGEVDVRLGQRLSPDFGEHGLGDRELPGLRRGAADQAEPWGQSALSTAAACLKGFYVFQGSQGAGREVAGAFKAARLPSRARSAPPSGSPRPMRSATSRLCFWAGRPATSPEPISLQLKRLAAVAVSGLPDLSAICA